MTDFKSINFGVDGDSITAGNQWSWHVFNKLGMKSHHNVAVGSSVWYKRTVDVNGVSITTQDYTAEDFAGISDGWEPTDDAKEIQMRMNNCAVVHIQRFVEEVSKGEYPAPDVFAFAMGTNDSSDELGDADQALSGKSKDVNLFTEAGAMRWCIQTIQENYPLCRIFVLMPLQTGDPEHNKKNLKVIDNMKKICAAMSVQVIDCYSGCGICEKYEVKGGEGRYLRDGLHPNLEGQALEGAFATKEISNNYF